jgi:transposase-like protein
MAKGQSAEKAIKDIRRKTRRRFSAEEKIRIVIEGMRGENSISDAVSPQRHCGESVLPVVERLSRGGQEAPGR